MAGFFSDQLTEDASRLLDQLENMLGKGLDQVSADTAADARQEGGRPEGVFKDLVDDLVETTGWKVKTAARYIASRIATIWEFSEQPWKHHDTHGADIIFNWPGLTPEQRTALWGGWIDPVERKDKLIERIRQAYYDSRRRRSHP